MLAADPGRPDRGRAWPPEVEVGVRAHRAGEPHPNPLVIPEPQAVDVTLIVPAVEGSREARPYGAERAGPAGLVVRLAHVRRGQGLRHARDSPPDVEAPSAGARVAPGHADVVRA